jgi:hypothetical protein
MVTHSAPPPTPPSPRTRPHTLHPGLLPQQTIRVGRKTQSQARLILRRHGRHSTSQPGWQTPNGAKWQTSNGESSNSVHGLGISYSRGTPTPLQGVGGVPARASSRKECLQGSPALEPGRTHAQVDATCTIDRLDANGDA